MPGHLTPIFERLVGRKCKFETRDGSIRNEKVVKIDYVQLEVVGNVVDYPIALHFDKGGLDSLELRTVKKISRE